MKQVWSDSYKIHSYEADTKGQATPSILCKYMQESAWNHAENLELGYSHLIKENLVWVMARKKFTIFKYPKWGETITVNTWPSGREKLLFYRDFRLLDEQGSEIGIASTVWFIIDINSRRPKRMNRDVGFDVWNMEQVYDTRPQKILPVEFSQPGKPVTVSYFDLDVNDHVNNIRYIDWIIDGYDHEFLQQQSLHSMEINFLSETVHSQRLEVLKTSCNGSDYFKITRKDDNTDVFLAKAQWKKCGD
ncbi:hypothetical protein JW935_01415 [candidate division KSB1 bacterium]|nr:hypothetical protein [candidate division KSB1 bacterium]